MRRAISGRLPAAEQPTRAQRAEIARCQARERPHAIAQRLGVSKRLVKAEVRRLRLARRATRPSARIAQSFSALAAALLLLANLGAGPSRPAVAASMRE